MYVTNCPSTQLSAPTLAHKPQSWRPRCCARDVIFPMSPTLQSPPHFHEDPARILLGAKAPRRLIKYHLPEHPPCEGKCICCGPHVTKSLRKSPLSRTAAETAGFHPSNRGSDARFPKKTLPEERAPALCPLPPAKSLSHLASRHPKN